MKSVLIMSANFRKAYPVAKSMKKAGYRVIGAFYAKRSSFFSRHFDKRYMVTPPHIDAKKYIKQVQFLANKYNAMIFPISFRDFKFTRYLDGKVPDIDPLAFDAVSDKLYLEEICKEAGVRYPMTIKSNYSTKIMLHLPWFKMRGWLYKRRFEDSEEFIAQQKIGGYGAGYYAIAVDGEPFIEYTHKRLFESVTGASLSCEFTDDEEVLEAGRKLVKYIGWTGPIMVEFRRDFKAFVIEVNPKFWGSLEMATSWGLDFPLCFVDGVDGVTRKRGGFTWILAGMTEYLPLELGKWLKLIWTALKRGHKIDLHLDDPAELLYGVVSRLWNMIKSF